MSRIGPSLLDVPPPYKDLKVQKKRLKSQETPFGLEKAPQWFPLQRESVTKLHSSQFQAPLPYAGSNRRCYYATSITLKHRPTALWTPKLTCQHAIKTSPGRQNRSNIPKSASQREKGPENPVSNENGY